MAMRCTGRLLLLLGTMLAMGCGEESATPPAASSAAPPAGAAAEAPAAVPGTAQAPASAAGTPGGAAAAEASAAAAAHPVWRLEVEGEGAIRIELLPERAPKNVASILDLTKQGFYDGTTFHRVIPDFMIQGGDPNSKNRDPRDDGLGGPGYTLPDEFSDAKHVRGVVSMANTGDPDSAGSQFFIVLTDQPDLDGRYTVVGLVVDGMDVVDRIAAVETDKYGRWGAQDRPRKDVVVKKATIEPPP